MCIKQYLKTIRIISYKYLFYFISDKKFIELQYRIRTKKNINLDNPQSFNEKIQKYKVIYKDELMHQCVDKIDVRNYIKDTLGTEKANEILIPLLDFNTNIENVDFDRLPNKFIIKLSNGSSFNKIIFNKSAENMTKIIRDFKFFSKAEYFYYGREWAYKGIQNRVLIEELLNFNGEIPDDYRFFCFNGKVEFIAVDTNSISNGSKNTKYNRNIYDRDWEKLDVKIRYENSEVGKVKPSRLDEMIEIAEKLAAPFPHVRVDFYYFDEKIYFGELTFYHASGYQEFTPKEFELKIGKKLII